MGFFHKLNKAIKDNLDIDLEKEAKKLVSEAMEGVSGALGDKNLGGGDLMNAAKGFFDGIKSSAASKNSSASKKTSETASTPSASKVSSSSTSAPQSSGSSKQTKAYTSVRSTQFVKTMAEKYLKEDVTVDEKGDVVAFLTAANKKPINWSKKYTIFPDSVTVESESLQYPKYFDSETFAKILRENKALTEVCEVRRYNDNTVGLYAEIKTDDGTQFYSELLKITMLMHGAHQMLADALEHEGKERVKFTTKLVTRLLDQNKMKYTVDSDGDVMVEHSKAAGKSFNWFTWYIISPQSLTLDSGSTDVPENFDIDNMAEQLQKSGGSLSKMVKVTRSQNGHLRLKCKIEATSPENIVKDWDNLHTLLENLWAGIYDLIQYETRQEAERKRREEEERERREAEAKAAREEELDAGFTYKLRAGGTIRKLQEAFTEEYPYLNIGVYMVKTGVKADREGGTISSYDSGTKFCDIRSFKGDCTVEIEGRSTPQSLEKHFREVSGLVIKIGYNDEDDNRYYISKDQSNYTKHICDLNREFRKAGYCTADIS